MSSHHNPIVITAIGTATPLGNDPRTFANRLLAGTSGIAPVQSFSVADHPSQIAGQVLSVPCPAELADSQTLGQFNGGRPVAFANLPRLEQMVLWCCSAALQEGGCWENRNHLRIGLVLGMGAEWHLLWEGDVHQGGRRIWQPERDGQSLLQRTAGLLGLSGPLLCISAACASGNYALAQAREWLRLGWVDVCLAGACDMAVSPMSLAGFGNLRALSRRNGDPQRASRPFDRQRDGFVMGEGGAVFLLESQASAKKRGSRVYAEVAGFGASSDAHNMVIPSPNPEPAAAAMRQALRDACINPEEIDYLNAHATSTPVGDISEARVLASVFGEKITSIPVSSTKSMTGHLLTAAAAVEALACLVALEHQALPPTINLEEPDPECPLCHVANQAWDRRVRVTASNSFGFGGSNTCLVLRAA